MSKHFPVILLALPLILQTINSCYGQSIDASLQVVSLSPPLARITGKYAGPPDGKVFRNFAMLREYAGFTGLADRVTDIRLEDVSGNSVAYREYISGEYATDRDYVTWSYKFDLTPHRLPAAAAHTSWIGEQNGLLFLDDLLPQVLSKDRSARVKLILPNGWKTADGLTEISSADLGTSVIFISKNLRNLSRGPQIHISINGSWKFTDEQVLLFTEQLIQEYRKIFGGEPTKKANVFILPFPQNVSFGTWEADTRGNTVTIVSSDMAFDTHSVQRLHEQLRHELFHLWVPNGVALTGRYDWCYEGFALYQSLKTGLALNRLRFDDFLDTLGRAMTIDAMLPSGRSLIESSASRVGAADTTIYAGGMLAAFLTDVELLKRSGGGEDVSAVLRTIYQKYRNGKQSVDGNIAVLETINSDAVTKYVRAGENVDWARELTPMGILVSKENNVTVLKTAPRASSKQKKMLDKLGYNNWRKLSAVPR